MKKLIPLACGIAVILIVTTLILNPLTVNSAQQGNEKGTAVPANVMKITEKSCVKCHAEPGTMMALSHLNLTKWDNFTAEKQGERAASMCNMVTKGKMPPKGFLEKNPGTVLTQDEIKTICDWSVSIAVSQK
jgi:cytochrome c5